ncbi:alpha/beta hydrolase [Nonomuraea ferruginea]
MAGGPSPVVVLVHGGYWRSVWAADLMEALCADLTARGFAVWNLEYRRPDLHGWDATTADVAAGMEALTRLDAPLDLGRLAVAGHSAGGPARAAGRRRRRRGGAGRVPGRGARPGRGRPALGRHGRGGRRARRHHLGRPPRAGTLHRRTRLRRRVAAGTGADQGAAADRAGLRRRPGPGGLR